MGSLVVGARYRYRWHEPCQSVEVQIEDVFRGYTAEDPQPDCELLAINAMSVVVARCDTGRTATMHREAFEAKWERA